jgi:prepilin-type N-terminal cleavage/methylation domain-containing protein
MAQKNQQKGFSLIELLTVLAIIGIISAIAIPTFMGQRARARSIGDAQSGAQVIRMQLESLKADSGSYGAVGSYLWSFTPGASTNVANGAAQATYPSITVPSSKMNYALAVANNGLTYTIVVRDPNITGAPEIYKTDQTGTSLPLP